MISRRTFRAIPTERIFSYLPEILKKIGVKVTSQKHQIAKNHFKGIVEGLKVGNPPVFIRIKIEKEEEDWSNAGGRFVPTVCTSHMTVETYENMQGGREDSRGSLELLKLFNNKISMYVWRAAG